MTIAKSIFNLFTQCMHIVKYHFQEKRVISSFLTLWEETLRDFMVLKWDFMDRAICRMNSNVLWTV